MVTYGKLKFNNGIYTGLIENGAANIAGIFEFSNGDTYLGEFVNNNIEGSGLLISRNGSTYLGEFNNNKRNGRFCVTYNSNGNKEYFIGDFKNDVREGQGYLYSKLDILDINYSNDKPIGRGTEYSYGSVPLPIGLSFE